MRKQILLLMALFVTAVVQGQTSKILTDLTPGGLKTKMTANEFTTVTNLTLSGTMDARDFLTIRQKMKQLTVIDLKNVTIAEYTGTEGIENGFLLTYPANTLSNSFYGMNTLTSVTLPEVINSIGANCFMNCANLSSVNIPSTLTSIGDGAFFYCKLLTSPIAISAAVTSIGQYAFGQSNFHITVDVANLNYSSVDGVLFNKDQTQLIFYPPFKWGDYAIPSTVKTLSDGAFTACNSLTSVTFPNSVTSMGKGTFAGCAFLRSVTLSESITRIEEDAFIDCMSLASVAIPNSVTSIGKLAFIRCSRLTSIHLPDSLTKIEDNAFDSCTGLTSVIIPNSVTTIGKNAFIMCSGLTSVTLPELLATIGDGAFYGCVGVTSISTNQVVPVNLPNNSVFFLINKTTCTLNVPAGSVELYKAAPVWKDFTKVNGLFPSSGKAITNSQVTVWPNPAQAFLTVNAKEGLVSIFNSQGKPEITQSLDNNQVININSLHPGMYLVVVNGESFKIIKE